MEGFRGRHTRRFCSLQDEASRLKGVHDTKYFQSALITSTLFLRTDLPHLGTVYPILGYRNPTPRPSRLSISIRLRQGKHHTAQLHRIQRIMVSLTARQQKKPIDASLAEVHSLLATPDTITTATKHQRRLSNHQSRHTKPSTSTPPSHHLFPAETSSYPQNHSRELISTKPLRHNHNKHSIPELSRTHHQQDESHQEPGGRREGHSSCTGTCTCTLYTNVCLWICLPRK